MFACVDLCFALVTFLTFLKNCKFVLFTYIPKSGRVALSYPSNNIFITSSLHILKDNKKCSIKKNSFLKGIRLLIWNKMFIVEPCHLQQKKVTITLFHYKQRIRAFTELFHDLDSDYQNLQDYSTKFSL